MSEKIQTSSSSVREMTHGEASRVGDVIADSHAEYPSFVYLFPDPAQRTRVLKRLMTGAAADAQAFGTVRVATQGDRVVGAAIWLSPGRFPWSAWRKFKAARTFAPLLWQTKGSTSDFFALGSNAAKSAPTHPHWYLQALGIRQEAQGRGLATDLLRPTLARADREDTLCYLETADPANVGFYEQFGFELDRKLRLIPGGPPHSSMWRPPNVP